MDLSCFILTSAGLLTVQSLPCVHMTNKGWPFKQYNDRLHQNGQEIEFMAWYDMEMKMKKTKLKKSSMFM